MIGKTFGRLVVIGAARPYVYPVSTRAVRQWGCRCDCGNITIVRESFLVCGHTTSCGCLHGEHLVRMNSSHGHTRGGSVSREYNSWANAKNRCYNEACPCYADYGGRGIRMADEWVNDFSAFLQYVGPAPKGTTLDRVDVDGHYAPGNVRWATKKEQARNRRSNRILTVNGVRRTVTEWSEISGIGRSTISARIARGLSAEDALSQPLDRRQSHNGKMNRGATCEHEQ